MENNNNNTENQQTFDSLMEEISSMEKQHKRETHTMVLPPKKKRKNMGLWIFIGILAAVFLLAILVSNSGSSEHSYAVSDPYLATIYVEGEIGAGSTDTFGNPIGYQHQWTLDQIDFLMDDDNNKGMILYVDSPGGGVYESDELYLKIKEYQETTRRPVYAYMAGYAASGGYYVLASSDKIVANRNTWTGSIGVKLGSMIDVSGLLERYGVNVTEIASGNNKNMGSMLQPMTDEQKAILQAIVNEAYDQFVGIVAEGTGLSIEQVRALADGRIYTAKQALALGLVDRIGTLEQTKQELKADYGLEYCSEVDVVYQSPSLFSSLFAHWDIEALLAPKGDVGQILNLVEEQAKYPISYLCDMVN